RDAECLGLCRLPAGDADQAHRGLHRHGPTLEQHSWIGHVRLPLGQHRRHLSLQRLVERDPHRAILIVMQQQHDRPAEEVAGHWRGHQQLAGQVAGLLLVVHQAASRTAPGSEPTRGDVMTSQTKARASTMPTRLATRSHGSGTRVEVNSAWSGSLTMACPITPSTARRDRSRSANPKGTPKSSACPTLSCPGKNGSPGPGTITYRTQTCPANRARSRSQPSPRHTPCPGSGSLVFTLSRSL